MAETTDDVLVTISANIQKLVDGFAQASSSVGTSLTKMTEGTHAASAGLEHVATAAHHAQHASEQTYVSMNSLGHLAINLRERFSNMWEVAGAAVAYEAIKKLDEELTEAAQRAVQLKENAEALGISTGQFQGMAAAAAEVNVPVDRMSRIMEMLQQRMAMAAMEGGTTAERFQQIGISMQELQDPSFSVISAMEKLGRASNSNKVLLGLLGARAADLIPILRELANNHDLLAEKQKDVLALDQQTIDTLARYNAAASTQKEQMENLTSVMSAQFAPAMIWIKEQIVEFVFALKDMGERIAGLFEIAGNAIGGFAASAYAAITGHFSEAKTIAIQAADDIADKWKSMLKQHEQNLKESAQAVAAIQKTFDAAPEKTGDKRNVGLPISTVTAQQQIDKLSQFAQQLVTKTTNMMAAGMRQQAALEAQIDKEKIDTAQAAANTKLQTTLSTLVQQESAIKDAYKTGQIDMAQDVQMTTQVLTDKLAAQLQYYGELEKLYAKNEKELEKLHQKELSAEQKHITKVQSLNATAVEQINKRWDKASDTIAHNWSSMIDKMLRGTMSLKDMFRATAESMVENWIASGTKMLAHTLTTEAAKREAAQLTGATKVQIEQTAAHQGMMASGMAAIKQIMNDAYQASAAAFHAVAGIPYVGPFLAPAAAAAAFASVAAMSSGIASAAGGWEVPSDQMAMVHKNEMILPASISSGLKGMIAANAGAGGPSLTTNHNYGGARISMLDTRGLGDLLSRASNRNALSSALGAAYRRGAR